MRWDQICLRIMLWSLAMTAAMGVAAIFSAGSEAVVRLLGTAATTAVAAALLWPLTRLAENIATRVAGLVGMAAVLLDFFLMLVLIWWNHFFRYSDFRFDEYILWTFFYVFLTAAPAVICLVFSHHPAGWLAARVGAAASALTFLELMAGTFDGEGHFPRYHWLQAANATGLFGSLGVASLAGTLKQRPWRWAGVLAALAGWQAVGVVADVGMFLDLLAKVAAVPQ